MNRAQVKSSFIQSIGYNAETMTLEVEFTHGRIYQYLEVPKVAYEELLAANKRGDSVGKIFPSIAGAHAHVRVDDNAEAPTDGVL